jgi:hypothetical protein
MGQEGEFAATHVSVNVASLTFARTGGPVNGEAHYLASGPVCPGEESQVGLDVVLQGSLDLQAGRLQGTAQWDFISSSPGPAGPGGACQVHQDEWRLVASFNGFLDDDRVVLEIRPDQNAIPGGYYGETYAVVELTVEGP